MKKTIFIFSALIVALLILFKVSTYSLLSRDTSVEIIIAIIAIIFFIIGILINKKVLQEPKASKPKTGLQKIEKTGLSKREHEVLCEIANGLSNKEIATKLFVSESTVKSHVSNILTKLNAKRRTQAIQIAKNLKIIPLH